MFFKIIVLKKSVNFTGKNLSESSLIKLQALRTPNFIKKRLQHRFFSAKFPKFSRTPSVAASAGLRFPACNFVKKETQTKKLFL